MIERKLVGIGDPIKTFVTSKDGKLSHQVKTVLEIHDLPDTKEGVRKLLQEIDERFRQQGKPNIFVQAGENLADIPEIEPIVDKTKVYVLEI